VIDVVYIKKRGWSYFLGSFFFANATARRETATSNGMIRTDGNSGTDDDVPVITTVSLEPCI
jgi:hypothetical protein